MDATKRSLIIRFILLFGIINMFADFTYEGARSITGPFMGYLGAGAAIIGVTAGLGELAGYALRSVAGYISDKTGKYWLVTFIGYVINMLAVPALALAGSWPLAAALIVAERTGRAIRKPAVESMLSYTTDEIGRGKVFGINEALDQGGATVGPLVVAAVLALRGDYRLGFAVLLITALLCLSFLYLNRVLYPRPRELERTQARQPLKKFSKSYWLFLAAGALVAAGFADFALIAFHFQQIKVIPNTWIPVYYAVAMGVGAVGAFVFGRLFDSLGKPVMLAVFFVSAFFAPLVFFGSATLALVGMILWGIGMSAQESLLKAVVSSLLPQGKRGTAFGLYDTGFGAAWFLGSALMGLLYAHYLVALVIFSVVTQLIALPVLWAAEEETPAVEG